MALSSSEERAKNDALRAFDLVEKGVTTDRYNEFGEKCIIERVYKTTNESAVDYMSDVVKDNSDILSVAASGDQYLNSVLYGAKNIDIFDINILAYYHTILKIVSASVLSLEEFKEFLVNEDDNQYTFLNKRYYNRVRSYLPVDVRMYFDVL